MNIVVLDGYAANPGDLCWDELQALGECTIYDRTAPAEVLERAAGAENLLTNKTLLTAEHMAALPELKYNRVLATGYKHQDTPAAKQRYHLCRRRRRTLARTSPCRQSVALRPQLLHHSAHCLGKHRRARTPHADYAREHQGLPRRQAGERSE